MQISIVIPSFNSAAGLAQTLDALSRQLSDAPILKVVVVDEGSTDHTPSVIAASPIPILDYIRTPREPGSGRSSARNRGLASCEGSDRVLFLDAGVVLPPAFLRRRTRIESDRRTVVVYSVLGLFARRALDLANTDVDERWLTKAHHEPDLEDPRKVLFDLTPSDLMWLPAPWAVGWSCCLEVPRVESVDVGGFDEAFVGWGAEDVDFCLRLFKDGCRFVHAGDLCALHVPHPVSPTDKERTYRVNRRRVYEKSAARETEAFMFLSTMSSNRLCLRLDSALPYLELPPMTGDALQQLALKDGCRLLIGPPPRGLVPTRSDHWVCLSRRVAEQLQHCAYANVACGLGTLLPAPDRNFELGIVALDWFLDCPDAIVAAMLAEVARVSRRVLLLSTPQTWSSARWNDALDAVEGRRDVLVQTPYTLVELRRNA